MRQTIYFAEWLEHKELQTPILMMLMITKRGVALNATGFVHLNLDLAIWVCRII